MKANHGNSCGCSRSPPRTLAARLGIPHSLNISINIFF